ncbi:hypothetical protein [Streptomyces cahuitamycinicus]|nr:hypothetical protein [Streptomyces cahuitamycinicus]
MPLGEPGGLRTRTQAFLDQHPAGLFQQFHRRFGYSGGCGGARRLGAEPGDPPQPLLSVHALQPLRSHPWEQFDGAPVGVKRPLPLAQGVFRTPQQAIGRHLLPGEGVRHRRDRVRAVPGFPEHLWVAVVLVRVQEGEDEFDEVIGLVETVRGGLCGHLPGGPDELVQQRWGGVALVLGPQRLGQIAQEQGALGMVVPGDVAGSCGLGSCLGERAWVTGGQVPHHHGHAQGVVEGGEQRCVRCQVQCSAGGVDRLGEVALLAAAQVQFQECAHERVEDRRGQDVAGWHGLCREPCRADRGTEFGCVPRSSVAGQHGEGQRTRVGPPVRVSGRCAAEGLLGGLDGGVQCRVVRCGPVQGQPCRGQGVECVAACAGLLPGCYGRLLGVQGGLTCRGRVAGGLVAGQQGVGEDDQRVAVLWVAFAGGCHRFSSGGLHSGEVARLSGAFEFQAEHDGERAEEPSAVGRALRVGDRFTARRDGFSQRLYVACDGVLESQRSAQCVEYGGAQGVSCGSLLQCLAAEGRGLGEVDGGTAPLRLRACCEGSLFE